MLNTRTGSFKGFTIVELLVSISISMLLLSLLLTAVNSAREAARRIECSNRLRQLTLSMHLHHDAWGVLPPGTSAKPSYRFQGWPVRLLPYLEKQSIYGEVETAISISNNLFNTSVHKRLSTALPDFTCPSNTYAHESRTSVRYGIIVGLTSFLGVSGVNEKTADGAFQYDYGQRFSRFTDGLSNTLLIGERPPHWKADLGWWYAGVGRNGNGTLEHRIGVNEINEIQFADVYCDKKFSSYQSGDHFDECHLLHFWSFHRGGGWFSLADGAIRFFPYTTDEGTLKALSTKDGGETAIDLQ